MTATSLGPRSVGRYLLLAELETAGTVSVWEGQDPERGLAVRITIVASPSDDDTEWTRTADRFLERGQRATGLSHPHLAATLDSAKDPRTGALYLVQEEPDGLPLESVQPLGKAMPVGEALPFVASVGRGLQAIHLAGLTHGHLSPRSVFVSPDGAPRLVNSGLASLALRPSTTDGSEAGLIPPAYNAPEQAVGEECDARTDVFALGALSYRLMTGHDAFSARGLDAILARVIHDHPTPASAVARGLPREVDEILAKALAKPRKDRYDDVAQLVEDVEDVFAGRPPAHARASASRVATDRFFSFDRSGLQDGGGLGSARLVRRRGVRVLAGLAALALVAGLELARRALDAPTPAPSGPPTVDAQRASGPSTGPTKLPGLPSREADIARLAFEFRHPLEGATVTVLVDGAPAIERRVRGRVKRSILGMKLREGRLFEAIEVAPGPHEIKVTVQWEDDQRTDAIKGAFSAGKTRVLSARIGRIGKELSVAWE